MNRTNNVKKEIIQFLIVQKGITHEDIAASLNPCPSASAVGKVLRSESSSQRIERAAAKLLQLPVQELFPHRYNENGEVVSRRRRKMKPDYDALAARSSAYAALQAQQAA